ncbi:MAG TPA: hypothetical protein VEF90_17795 [Xanthobacteraceae bacterium]|nr:hypothetical protein [Xanthobacteraceae bacterium]
MKKLAILVVAGLLAGCAEPALAADKLGDVAVSPLNCDALGGDSRVCVVNKTHSSIVGIDCAGHFWGTARQSVPGGRIPSGGIGVVDFKNGACGSGIFIRTSDGQTHQIPGQDVDKTTVLTIESETW